MANIIKIESLDRPELDVFVRLTGAQLRSRLEPEKAVFIAESPTVIEVALNSGCVPVSILTDERLLHGAVEGIIEKCDREFPGIPVYTADRDTLRDITGFELTRGALCAMRRPILKSPEEICRDAKRIAVLEGIADSTNIGAIFRSAAALGIDAVLLTPTSCDPLSRRALRVSMGTVMQVPWTVIGSSHTDWPENGMKILHALGFKTAAMALTDDSVSIEDEALCREERLAIILGTEGDGLAKATIASCDYTVKIPMSHGVDSLNVAAASAVAFWQLRRK
jgi:tRNA G18 (ribose-2'-O)-methylase SpoU